MSWFSLEAKHRGVSWLAFWAITAFIWLGVVVSLGVGNVRIGKGDEEDQITGKGSSVGSLFLEESGEGGSWERA